MAPSHRKQVATCQNRKAIGFPCQCQLGKTLSAKVVSAGAIVIFVISICDSTETGVKKPVFTLAQLIDSSRAPQLALRSARGLGSSPASGSSNVAIPLMVFFRHNNEH